MKNRTIMNFFSFLKLFSFPIVLIFVAAAPFLITRYLLDFLGLGYNSFLAIGIGIVVLSLYLAAVVEILRSFK